jgi:ribonuclease Y
MTGLEWAAIILAVAGPLGAIVAYRVGSKSGRDTELAARRAARDTAEELAKRIMGDAERDADGLRKQAVLTGKEEAMRAREEWEGEARRRREEIDREEKRLQERESVLDRKFDVIESRDKDLGKRASDIGRKEKAIEERQGELDRIVSDERRRLEQLAGLSASEAKAELVRRMEEEAHADAASRLREIRETAKRNADRESRKIVALAVQRIAAEHTAEITASAVSLPKDDMKGRSIEEVVEKAKKEVDAGIVETGERAAYDVNIHGLHPELIKLIGRMKWRTSYGQNILQHSKEVAWLAGIMATELGLDATMARRGALLHDVGKVLTHEHEGTHVQLGVEVATKYGEHPLVVNCIAAHHDDVPHESEVSVLVQAADAISGSRPGARREAFETYVKRLEGLEKIASSYRGVDRVFAIQAGREIRVLVNPEEIDDARMQSLTEEIARRVESELQYPGQIKVVAIREKRAMDIAR